MRFASANLALLCTCLGAPVLAAPSALGTSLAEASASFVGEAPGDEAASSLAIVGDVNGDARDDLLVGAWANDTAGPDAGKVYLILGRRDGWAMRASLASADASFVGERANDFAGFAVARAGDVNGDGLDDFLIGAQGHDGGAQNTGKAYLIFGRAAADWGQNISLSTADAAFAGHRQEDYAGFSLAGAGDVNGDGLDDFLVSRACNIIRESAGITALIFGRSSDWPQQAMLESADATFRGERDVDHAGYAMAGVGDVDGDSLADFVLGAWGHGTAEATDQGIAYLIRGRRDGWPALTPLAEATVSIVGEAANDRFGHCVAGVGDVNGDGLGDFLVGAPRNREGGGSTPEWGGAGQIYLFLGRREGWEQGKSAGAAAASFFGEGDGDLAGQYLAPAGDVNGDGFDDFLIGAHRGDAAGADAGQVYLILGRASGWAMDQPLAQANATFVGEARSDQAGSALAGGGDLDGDGRADFVIGAHFSDAGGTNAGQVYVFLSSAR